MSSASASSPKGSAKAFRCSRPLNIQKHPKKYDRRVKLITAQLLQQCNEKFPLLKLHAGLRICGVCDVRMRQFIKEGTLAQHVKPEFGGLPTETPEAAAVQGEQQNAGPGLRKRKRAFLMMPPRSLPTRSSSATFENSPSRSGIPAKRGLFRSLQIRRAGRPNETIGSSTVGSARNHQAQVDAETDGTRALSNSDSSDSEENHVGDVEAINNTRQNTSASDGASTSTNRDDSSSDYNSEANLSLSVVNSASDASAYEEDIDNSNLNGALRLLKSPKVTAKVKNSPSRFRNVFKAATRNLQNRFESVGAAQNLSVADVNEHCRNCKWLLAGCKEKFKKATTKKEKYLILSLFNGMGRVILQKEFSCSEHMARCAVDLRNKEGPFSSPTYVSSGHPISRSDINTVIDFYLDDGNSRVSPRMGDTKLVINHLTGLKERVAKRRILCGLRDLFEAFKDDNYNRHTANIKIGISKFAMLRPKQCEWPGSTGFHNTCLCVIHENFKFIMHGLGEDPRKMGDFIRRFLCNVPGPDCYLGFCPECPHFDILDTQYELQDEKISFPQWESTDRATIKDATYECDDFKNLFKKILEQTAAHHFIMKCQKSYIDDIKTRLFEEDAILILVDFAENYRYILQDAIQGVHWSNDSATIHPFVVYYPEEEPNPTAESPDAKKNVTKYSTFVAISDTSTHDAFSFHAFLSTLWKKYGDDPVFAKAQKVYYASDGAGSQYKNKYNFYNLMRHRKDFQKPAEWVFFATAHGKSPCDGISGVIKRKIRLVSLSGVNITNSLLMIRYCESHLASEKLHVFHVSNDDFRIHKHSIEERIPLSQTVKGTRKFHSFEPVVNVLRCKFTSSSESYTDHLFDTIPEFEEYAVGEFVAFNVYGGFAIGKILSLQIIEEEIELSVQVMHQVQKQNLFSLDQNRSVKIIWDAEVILRIRPPKLEAEGLYSLNQVQFDQIIINYI